MSGKTKTELLAENVFLQDVIDALHGKVERLTDEVKRLERTYEVKDGIIHFLLEDGDRIERDKKIYKAAHQGTITKFIDERDEFGRILKRRGKGLATKQEKNKKKSDYCTGHYEQLLADGTRHGIARRKANEATAEKFGKELKKSALYKHCPPPSADK